MNNKKFGENLKKIRQDKGLSVEQLSELSGLHVVSISLLENGKNKPRTGTIYKLINALGCKLEDLTE